MGVYYVSVCACVLFPRLFTIAIAGDKMNEWREKIARQHIFI